MNVSLIDYEFSSSHHSDSSSTKEFENYMAFASIGTSESNNL